MNEAVRDRCLGIDQDCGHAFQPLEVQVQVKAAEVERDGTNKLLAEKSAQLQRLLAHRDRSHKDLKVGMTLSALLPLVCMFACIPLPCSRNDAASLE